MNAKRSGATGSGGSQGKLTPDSGTGDDANRAVAGGPTDGPVVGGKAVSGKVGASKDGRTASGARPGGSAVPVSSAKKVAKKATGSASAAKKAASSSVKAADAAATAGPSGAPAATIPPATAKVSTAGTGASKPLESKVKATRPATGPQPIIAVGRPASAVTGAPSVSGAASSADDTAAYAAVPPVGSSSTAHRPPVGGPDPSAPASRAGAPTSPRASILDSGSDAKKKVSGAPRRVKLTISRIDPWSVMKMSFLLSVALGIGLWVAVAVLWSILDGQGVFQQVNDLIRDVLGSTTDFNLNDFVEFSKVQAVAAVIAVADVVLFTALGTLGAFLYNIVAALVGGIHLTLTDD